ncbi:DNA methyltransferase [Sorangium sp. So ce260]|uniref:DNA methyltransferase n=1 Tax=Sorangium sp. So ce260 TaxID=3133291 RepID=UPI003F5EA833
MVPPLATFVRQNLRRIARRSRTLPALRMDRPVPGESRAQQAEVAGALADRAFDALGVLLRGFEEAAERDGPGALEDALARGPEHLYGGLLTALLRLVFLLHAEARGLLPVDHPRYAAHLGVRSLFRELEAEHAARPAAMRRRSGAWARLVALFRAVFHGIHDPDLALPARRGQLFDPERYPFLEQSAAGAPGSAHARAAADERGEAPRDGDPWRAPSVDDATVRAVLERLLVLDGRPLSYLALDVEQLGGLYEALMGYRVERAAGPTVCLRPERVWVSAAEALAQPRARRAAWLAERAGLSRREAKKLDEALAAATTEADLLQALGPLRARDTEVLGAGRLFLQPGAERRRTSSHYTPRSLSAPIVARALEPLLRQMGEEPPSARLLGLAICDPAMGSGAFLMEACRYLADQVATAWTREAARGDAAAAERLARGREEAVGEARRLVARRCLYGADKNPHAVSLARLSLWLVTRARDEPFTFVDHALRHGDSLVGLDLAQLRGFHWKPAPPLPPLCDAIDATLERALALRQQLAAAGEGSAGEDAARARERLAREAEEAIGRARLLGDLVVGAFFAHEKDRDRLRERHLRAQLASAWLGSGGPPPEELLAMQRALREGAPGGEPPLPAFHWALEFPEVFEEARPDRPAGDRAPGPARLHAFVGNPPFLGGKRISTDHGDTYAAWLEQLHGATKNTDLAAHFFRRAAALLGGPGTVGLIATNTIAQGDTRRSGLKPLVEAGRAVIYHAVRSVPWPGDAAVHVAVVHLAVGMSPADGVPPPRLDGLPVRHINSHLRAMPERPDPRPLASSRDLCFIGCFLRGDGFVLTDGEARALRAGDPAAAEVLRPFLGGEEVNSSPSHSPHRHVIDFGERGLEDAGRWPALLSIVRSRVKPARDRLKLTGIDAGHRARWWQFANTRPELRRTIAPLGRCLVAARVTKHLCFAFQPAGRTFSDQLCVFAIDDYGRFAVLQSRAHESWARLLSSTMGEGLRYAPSDCVETFPFPRPEHLAAGGRLEVAGERLYTARARLMVELGEGLTAMYNLLKDPACERPGVVELRRLHEEMDRAVLAAYGFGDIDVPPYTTPVTPGERSAADAFDDRVIDRLFALNEARAAEEERRRGEAEPRGRQPGQRSRAPGPGRRGRSGG